MPSDGQAFPRHLRHRAKSRGPLRSWCGVGCPRQAHSPKSPRAPDPSPASEGKRLEEENGDEIPFYEGSWAEVRGWRIEGRGQMMAGAPRRAPCRNHRILAFLVKSWAKMAGTPGEDTRPG